MKLIILVTSMILFSFVRSQNGTDGEVSSKLIYILLDGFRWDYVDQQPPESLPGFTRLLSGGVRAQWTNPIFPSVSFPSWTSLSTGLYAESHGIVGNYFYDPLEKDVFNLDDETTTGKQKWWSQEPIWTTATLQNVTTAAISWSRCDVPYGGVLPEHCLPFVGAPDKETFQNRTEEVLEKLDEGFQFVLVYTDIVDHAGHDFGPMSEETKKAVRDVDDVILFLQNELDNKNYSKNVNIIIVSDHGMTSCSSSDVEKVEVDDYLDAILVENIADWGPFMNIKVAEENIQTVYDRLSMMSNATVFKHDEIPVELNWKDHQYSHDILVMADPGLQIMPSRSPDKQLPVRVSGDDNYKGSHGYYQMQDMNGIFFAKGPAFHQNKVIEPIHLVDIYQVVARVLNVTARAHNGTWQNVEGALVNGSSSNANHSIGILCIVYIFLKLNW